MLADFLLSLLFPSKCVVCDGALVRGERIQCSRCLINFPFYYDGMGARENADNHDNYHYRHFLFYYSKSSDYHNLIYKLKYGGGKNIGIYLGRMLGALVAKDYKPDYIIPIPLHKKRKLKRGYNQSLYIANGISKVIGSKVLDKAVFRIINNSSQTGRSHSERKNNAEGIFKFNNTYENTLSGKHILIVDDVFTTGSTINSCIKEFAHIPDLRISIACLAISLNI